LPDGSIPPGAGACGISGNGRFVGFLSSTGSQTVGLYIRDLQTSTTQLVVGSVTGWSICPFTRDGSQIAFTSSLTTLVPGDTNDHADVFVANVGAGTFERINMSPSGQQEARPDPTRPDINASRIAMSRDGRFVTFWSTSANMVPSNHSSVFLRDRATQTTQEVSVGYPTGPDWQICFSQNEGVSNDGRYVSFSVLCEKADGAGRPTDLVGTFMRDRVAGVTTRVDELPDGTPANGFSGNSFMSADGRYVTYMSYASNLVPDDTNRFPDLFIRRVS
jgi:Tol biopolymer transport system component